MDNYIWDKVIKFLKRLHGNKGWNWIKNRYFPPYNDKYHHCNWILTDPGSGITLDKMSWYKVKKYIMVKHDSSPHDKDKQDYFKHRESNFSFFY